LPIFLCILKTSFLLVFLLYKKIIKN